MSEDRDIDVSHDLASFVSELRRLADALEHSTKFTIHIDGEDVTIPEGAKFSVAHEREAGEIELEFQITWSVASDNADEETQSGTVEAADEDSDEVLDAGADEANDEGSEDQNADENGVSGAARA